MSQVRVNESSLTNIADAIRDKNHEVTKYKPSEMPAAISRIKTSEPVFDKLTVTENGKYTPPAEIDGYNEVDVNVQPNLTSINITANGQYTPTDTDGFNEVNVAVEGIPTDADLTITGNCQYKFAYDGWNWFINKYGNRITTNNIKSANYMFYSSYNLIKIPFDINFSSDQITMTNMFYGCHKLQAIPKLVNAYPTSLESIFQDCHQITKIDDEVYNTWNWSYIDNNTSGWSGAMQSLFRNCYNLRKLPMNFIKHGNPVATNYYCIYSYLCTYCYCLDEVISLPFPHYNATWTNNVFSDTFDKCCHLKDMTFALTDNGTPQSVRWTNQTLNLNNYVGYGWHIDSYGGLPKDKEIKDDTTYQALKNDPDAWTRAEAYSRYNHDSAVRTINSLPDTTGYSATPNNTIKFHAKNGRLTDGGAIETLTAEEIAVASAKGWTVSLT